MGYFDASDIVRVCHEVHRFQQKANWRWKGLPVLTWEFADRTQFERARAELMQTLEKELLPGSAKAMERIHTHNHAEIDCHGVTFRLLFKEV